jgi:hypothetical protein
MKIVFRETTIMREPMFSVRPKAFDTINVITAFGSVFFFANHNMISANIKERISMRAAASGSARRRMSHPQRRMCSLSGSGTQTSTKALTVAG